MRSQEIMLIIMDNKFKVYNVRYYEAGTQGRYRNWKNWSRLFMTVGITTKRGGLYSLEIPKVFKRNGDTTVKPSTIF
jgi:hypothetical protein